MQVGLFDKFDNITPAIMNAHEIGLYNDLLFELYAKWKGADPFVSKSGHQEAVMIELLKDDLVLYRTRDGMLPGNSYMVFGISNHGKELMEKLPGQYVSNPYGWFLEKKKEKDNFEKAMKEKADAKLDYDLKMAKRAYRFYWVTFFMAFVSLIVSVIALFLKHK